MSTLVVPNVIMMIGLMPVTVLNAVILLSRYFHFGLIMVTVPNLISCILFINRFCADAVLERSTDKEWHNPPGTFSEIWGDPLEQSCLGVGNSNTRRIHHQQLTIIYSLMCRLHTVARERERERERENI